MRLRGILGQGSPRSSYTDHLTLCIPIPRNTKAQPWGWAKCKNLDKKFWLPDLGSNQGQPD
jgi:hypothetical protein